MKAKAFYTSKTFWFGALWLVIGVANWFGFGDYQPEAKVNEIFEILNGVAIIFLRFKTNTPVKL